MVCHVTSEVSLVPRSRRLRTMERPKDTLPTSAKPDDSDSAADDGRSMISTPQKPTRMATQRRQPTFSPSSRCESAAT